MKSSDKENELPKKPSVSYVNKSTESFVPVTVSSETNTMVKSSISSEINNGLSSYSIVNKPTLASSSMNVNVTSWSKVTVNESSRVATNSSNGNDTSSHGTSIGNNQPEIKTLTSNMPNKSDITVSKSSENGVQNKTNSSFKRHY